MVALALSSIILMMIAKVFSGASQILTVADQTTEVYSNVRITLDIMQEQLESICPEWVTASGSGTNPNPNAIKGIVGVDSSDTDTVQIRFSDPDGTGSIDIVDYQVDSEGNLTWCFHQSHSSGDAWNPSTTPRTLLKNVTQFNVQYWDHKASTASWKDTWNPDDYFYLPLMVKVEVTVAGVVTRANGEPGDVTFTRVLQLPSTVR